MTRHVLTREERRQQYIRHAHAKWDRMTPEQQDAFIMRAMDSALNDRQQVTKDDLRLAGVPKEAADRSWSRLLPIVIKARPNMLPVLGSAE